MRVRLYAMEISHPSLAAALMLDHKGIAYSRVDVPMGLQSPVVRLAGFAGNTVPALKLGNRLVLGSLAISRALDEVRPEPPLFPRDPDARRAVEEAEAWGERVLQPVPRRLLRHALSSDAAKRETFARMAGLPLPGLAATAMRPVAAFYARREEASSAARVLADHDAMPARLDHVDALIGAGVLGGEALNAADFQLGTTLRVLLSLADYEPLVTGRPAEALARRVLPAFPYAAPPLLPARGAPR